MVEVGAEWVVVMLGVGVVVEDGRWRMPGGSRPRLESERAADPLAERGLSILREGGWAVINRMAAAS
jgi:hypothetical protein